MTNPNEVAREPYGMESYWWGDVYTGEPAALMAAGVLQAAWLFERPHRGRRIEYPLGGGRTASVKRRRGTAIEVRVTVPPDEQAQREAAFLAAQETERKANREKFQRMASDHRHAIASLAQCLGKRYPGVRIVGARLHERHDGSYQQELEFSAPLETLLASGLLTPGMLAYSRQGDQRRGPRSHRFTPSGCGFSVAEDASTGTCTLRVFTGPDPHGPQELAIGQAQRLIAKIMQRAAIAAGER